MQLIAVVITGALAGAHASTWGMYKDAPHEGFEVRKYQRSITIGAVIAPLVVLFARVPADTVGGLVVVFAVTYALERALSEFHKTFVRREDQAKYFIPMQLAVNGRVVESYPLRLLAGACVAGAAILLVTVAAALHVRSLLPVSPLSVLALGSLGGWISAVGGALKDAPHEGFELRKFFRSPVFSAAYALLLSLFTDNLVLCALGGLGLTIATLETYKTFFFPSRPRGKFAGKPVLYPDALSLRRYFVPLYVLIWVLLVTGVLAGASGR